MGNGVSPSLDHVWQLVVELRDSCIMFSSSTGIYVIRFIRLIKHINSLTKLSNGVAMKVGYCS